MAQIVKKTKQIEPKLNNADTFIATSAKLSEVIKIANKVSKTDLSILLQGESGVGKEVFATYIHQHSNRKNKPMISLNMAAIPDNLIESELFGYEKGAFTDAVNKKSGEFEKANGGTLFLDEIAEMPYAVQAKLLRALQEKEIRPLGSSKPIKIDVRIVSATNANLVQKIQNGEFREDLYYRLNTIPLNIPPLRERTEEILPIAKRILEKNCKEYKLGEKIFSQEAQADLLAYKWPGNIRELISVVQRAAILSETNIITADSLYLHNRGL